MNYEYANNIREASTIALAAQKESAKKMNEHNWLNEQSSRDHLREVMHSDGYKQKMSEAHLGDKNGMYGKKPVNYKHGKKCYTRYVIPSFEWNKIREFIFKKYSSVCADCGSNDNLQVHHKVPYFISEDNSEDNLILLCAKCHMKHEPQQLSVRSVTKVEDKNKTYNFAVEDDESYVANDIIAHNCRCVIELRLKDDEDS